MIQIHFMNSRVRRYWTRFCFAGLLLLGTTACANLNAQRNTADSVPVGVIGVQHMGEKFSVGIFYIDGAGGTNVGRAGGGGGSVCCGSLPAKWHPGMTAVVRWSVVDWSHENRAEIEAENYTSIKSGGRFKATVLIEKYDEPGRVYVHFFPGGKVRVISSNLGVLHPDYPILYGPHDDATATEGVAVEELFSPEEKEERKRQRDAQRKKYGDWR